MIDGRNIDDDEDDNGDDGHRRRGPQDLSYSGYGCPPTDSSFESPLVVRFLVLL
jgi:hypothetical protein